MRSIALLQGLGPERLEMLARRCAWRHYARGQSIVTRAAADRDVHFIVAGKVRVTTYSAAGRQVTFRDLAAGELFGEVAALDDLPRSADVVALESVLTASLPPAAFRQLLHEESTLAERVMRSLSGVVRRMSERVVDLSTARVHQRIHAELLRLAREAGVAHNSARLDPPPKHADLASQVSTYREEVTRELSALARTGILGKDGRALLIRDVRRLEALVERGKN